MHGIAQAEINNQHFALIRFGALIGCRVAIAEPQPALAIHFGKRRQIGGLAPSMLAQQIQRVFIGGQAIRAIGPLRFAPLIQDRDDLGMIHGGGSVILNHRFQSPQFRLQAPQEMGLPITGIARQNDAIALPYPINEKLIEMLGDVQRVQIIRSQNIRAYLRSAERQRPPEFDALAYIGAERLLAWRSGRLG